MSKCSRNQCPSAAGTSVQVRPEYALNTLSPEERLAGLAPEQILKALPAEDVIRKVLNTLSPEERLAGLAPEERLAGLDQEQLLLALPDAALRSLSDEYLATLSEPTREAIRQRVGR